MTGMGQKLESSRILGPCPAAQLGFLRLNQTLALSKILYTAALETGSFGTPISKEGRWLAGEEAVPDFPVFG